MGYYAYQSVTLLKTEGRTLLAANELGTSVEVVDAMARNVGWLALKMTIAYFSLWGLSLSYLVLLFAGIELPVWFAVICSTILAFRPITDCVLIWKSPMYLGPGAVSVASASRLAVSKLSTPSAATKLVSAAVTDAVSQHV
jgi:hypothetical protein